MLIPLEKEIEHIRAYLSLEQVRFPDKYQVRLKMEPGLEKVLIPPFTLQPLIENAIYHGIKPKTDGLGRIYISGSKSDTTIKLVVVDNGVGISDEQLKKLQMMYAVLGSQGPE